MVMRVELRGCDVEGEVDGGGMRGGGGRKLMQYDGEWLGERVGRSVGVAAVVVELWLPRKWRG